MRTRRLFISLIISMFHSTFAQSEYDHHVVFDNSLTDRSYYFSRGYAVAPSTLEIGEGKFPIEEQKYFSAPNALRLQWRSHTGGDWRMTLEVANRYGQRFEFEGNTLFLRCYSETELSLDESPLIGLQDSNGAGVPDIKLLTLIKTLPAKQWVQIKLPFAAFKPLFNSTDENKFNPRQLARIFFVQGLDDGKEHTLYIDDVRVGDDVPNVNHVPATPTGLSAV
ncbi:hypothetical protein HUU05_10000, partial [candidate division KSB1 bacterium]|nr:hypothetical protein [candidate division KSB1 bacterium]